MQDGSPRVTRVLKLDDRVSPMCPALLQHPSEGPLSPPLSLLYGGANQGSERLGHQLKASELGGG